MFYYELSECPRCGGVHHLRSVGRLPARVTLNVVCPATQLPWQVDSSATVAGSSAAGETYAAFDVHPSTDAARKQLLLIRNVAALVSVAVVGAYAGWFFGVDGFRLSRDAQDWASSGDFVAGWLNPILSFAALLALLTTLRLQTEELSLTRAELFSSSRALQRQAELASAQLFEVKYARARSRYEAVLDDCVVVEVDRDADELEASGARDPQDFSYEIRGRAALVEVFSRIDSGDGPVPSGSTLTDQVRSWLLPPWGGGGEELYSACAARLLEMIRAVGGDAGGEELNQEYRDTLVSTITTEELHLIVALVASSRPDLATEVRQWIDHDPRTQARL